MKKRFLSMIVVILCMSLLLSSSAFAAPSAEKQNEFYTEAKAICSSINLDKEINDASKNVIDKTISAKVLKNISVGSTDKNAEVNYTVKNLGTNLNDNGTESTVYSLTAVTKTNISSSTAYGFTAWVSIQWIDNGLADQLLSAAGGWSPDDPFALSHKQVWYGVSTINFNWVSGLYSVGYPSADEFYYSAPSNYTGILLRAYSYVDVYGTPLALFCDVFNI